MAKTLTISIAAYNVEKYIRKTLDSIVTSNRLDELEVFIIDDGGNDNTLSIAKQYAEKYPNTFIPVHKTNGGYGSTVDYGLKHATGKYFRLLDGDDWIDEEHIQEYIDLLKTTTSDIVLTDVNYCYEHDGEQILREADWRRLQNKEYSLSADNMKYLLSMWQLTVKLDCLKREWRKLPEHTLYTDQLFVYYALLSAKTVKVQHISVYCYRLGREGQSVNIESRKNHWEDLCVVYKEMLNDYKKRVDLPQAVDKRLETIYAQVINTFLLFPPEKKWIALIKEYEKELKLKSRSIYRNMWWTYKRITLLRLSGYMAYRGLANKNSF